MALYSAKFRSLKCFKRTLIRNPSYVDAVEIYFTQELTTSICEDYDCDYRYGFQGQEKDDEIKGRGNSVNYTYRMHDPRLGRFFTIDPLVPKYPYLTPYQFSSNQPIHAPELEGLESSDEINIQNIGGEKVDPNTVRPAPGTTEYNLIEETANYKIIEKATSSEWRVDDQGNNHMETTYTEIYVPKEVEEFKHAANEHLEEDDGLGKYIDISDDRGITNELGDFKGIGESRFWKTRHKYRYRVDKDYQVEWYPLSRKNKIIIN